ncbi:MAG: hypothetical protein AAFQ19_09800 [Pseudomonadota bacterium]
MKLGLAAIAVSILCLLGSFAFGAPIWMNILGLVSGIGGLFLLSKEQRSK